MDFTGVILKNDLMEWAEKAGAQFHRQENSWRSHCPLHHGDNKSGFAIYNENGKQHYKCFTGPCGCGDVLDFVQAWQGCDKVTAYRILGGEEKPDPIQEARNAEEKARRAIADLEAKVAEANRVLDELRHAQAWLTYHNNLTTNDRARGLWHKRGIPEDWQRFWQVGYCPEFAYSADGARVVSPTLTIPIFDETRQVVNLRHRILQPINPVDKYRPDRSGLPAVPFIGNPGIGWDTDPILVVEGEIKSMVTYRTIYQDGEPMQVIGIPGKSTFRTIADRLQGHEVYICFDPDANTQAVEAAKCVHARVMVLPKKIDDAILAGSLDRKGIQFRMYAARKV